MILICEAYGYQQTIVEAQACKGMPPHEMCNSLTSTFKSSRRQLMKRRIRQLASINTAEWEAMYVEVQNGSKTLRMELSSLCIQSTKSSK